MSPVHTWYWVASRLQVRTSGAMYATVPTVDLGADAYMFCGTAPDRYFLRAFVPCQHGV